MWAKTASNKGNIQKNETYRDELGLKGEVKWYAANDFMDERLQEVGKFVIDWEQYKPSCP